PWTPGRRRTDDKAIIRLTANTFVSEATKQEFHSPLQFFVTKPKWRDDTLRHPPFAATIATCFLFEEKIESPFRALEEIFREQQAQLVSIGNVHRSVETARTKFVSWSWRTFIVQNSATANFVFRKNGRI